MTIRITDDELILLWHTDEPSHMMARRLCVTNEWLRRSWDRLRRDKRLPDGRRSASHPSPMDSREQERDGRPSTTPLDDSYDPLLDALCEHHNVAVDPMATREGRPDLVKLKTKKEIFDERKRRGRGLEGGRGRDEER